MSRTNRSFNALALAVRLCWFFAIP